MKFRKKPVVVDAVRFNGREDADTVIAWARDGGFTAPMRMMPEGEGELLLINTLEGVMGASPGDWVIRGVHGEIYPCKPDIFDATYEAV